MAKKQTRPRDAISVDAKEAVDLATAQTYTENVFLFLPNIIGQSDILYASLFHAIDTQEHLGYTRVILAGLSLHFMSYHPKYCTILYCISQLLDAVDGQVARARGETSKFGAVLDMVTDRFAHAAITCIECLTYIPNTPKMHNIVSAVLSVVCLPQLCYCVPSPHCSRLCQPLHAHVQVRICLHSVCVYHDLISVFPAPLSQVKPAINS